MSGTRRSFCAGLVAGLAGSAAGCSGRGSSTEAPARHHVLDDIAGAVSLLWPDRGIEGRQGAETPSQRAAMLELIHGIAAGRAQGGDPPPPLRALAREVAMTLETWTIRGTPLWVLREAEAERRGAGAYLFRAGAEATGRPLVLQSPHVFHDQGTGRLALGVMAMQGPSALRPQVLCVNTRHRYRPGPGPEVRHGSPSDVCHAAEHPFNTVLAGLAQAEPRLEVAQLHGFADREVDRLDGEGREPLLAVVSAGAHARSQEWASQVASVLRGAWGGGARLFPEQTRRLGATTNVQGRLLAAHPQAWFVHVELSASIRGRPEAEVVTTLAEALASPPAGGST